MNMELTGIMNSKSGHAGQTFILTLVFMISLTFQTSAFPSGQGKSRINHKRSVLRSREPRSGDSYDSVIPGSVSMQTLTNASIMVCTEAMAQPYARMVHLTDDHMRALLQNKGGNYVRDYMAATQEEALENFPNMLILTRPLQESDGVTSFSLMDNLITKQMIIDDLNKLTAYLMSNISSPHDNSTQPVNNNSHLGGGLNPDNSYLTTSTFTSENVQTKIRPSTSKTFDSTMPSINSGFHSSKFTTSHYFTPKTILNSNSYNNTKSTQKLLNTTESMTTGKTEISTPAVNEYSSNSFHFNTTDKSTAWTAAGTSTSLKGTTSSDQIMSTSAGSTSNSMSTKSSATPIELSNSVTKETASTTRYLDKIATTTIDPDILKSIEELKQYVQGSENLNNLTHIGKRDLETVWRNAYTTLHPAILLGLSAGNRRVKRHADGSYSREEYCQNKGSLTADHKYVHLCSICATTTKLPDDTFPRYINEAVCKTGDNDCFTIAGTSHGQCKQTKFSLNMLRRKVGHCNMIIHGGETLVFDNWKLAPQQINVSCECTINKLSVFSKYAGLNVPLG